MSKALALGLYWCLFSVAHATNEVVINGAGATFPLPLYSKLFNEYRKLHPDVIFNYQPIGSGGGIKKIIEGSVDFGASDFPMTPGEMANVPGVVHVPTVLGAVVVVFNLPNGGEMRLSASTLSGILLGKIKKWDDPALANENPGVKFPGVEISVVHRSDDSGTTAIFTEYLTKVSPEWKRAVGSAKTVNWPTGAGAKGNEGVASLVSQRTGCIGYVELAYAIRNKLPMVALKNRDGEYVKPTLESTSAAAAGLQIPADFRISITDPKGQKAYPIASFTYLLVRGDQVDKAKGAALLRFLWWAEQDAQRIAPSLDYAPLPAAMVQKVKAKLETLTIQGKSAALD